MTFHCTACGEEHEGLPDVGMWAPDPYLSVPEDERAARTTLTQDRCTVRDEDGLHYFVRGVIFIPIHGQDEPFGLGVWVSQSRANYERYERNEEMAPTFGWLVNRIAHYAEDTFLLKTRVHFHEGTSRPTIELEPTAHPLAIDQRCGISLARAWQIVHRYSPN
ncbi:hypothetical protein AKJ09_11243 [Labilithrix luteola]|uniref:DUF2199 domain-containing protein n=1 Tax=Labilithrix luteola TaxID=1391654 RepID=A0A0K1QGL8_9BACT|nr:DUF2199 domain-containing protein [Labilithrix luteola]AKV04580.1 hypothetical protein AKJ09_11243 [Labilithrix luteola]